MIDPFKTVPDQHYSSPSKYCQNQGCTNP